MAKEALSTLLLLVCATLILTAGAIISASLYIGLLSGLLWIVTGFSLYFFRDPERVPPERTDAVLAPADGKILRITRALEKNYVKKENICITIFLSLLDVHIIRAPVSGAIGYFSYKKGQFYPAYKKEAGELNERASIGIDSAAFKVLFKMIAGKIARRIVCPLREGHYVSAGDKIGMIKFGSRVDIYLPSEVHLSVTEGDRIRAGETILGTHSNETSRATG